ncbi:hypothetical protein IAU60_003150 [Kwoniella sp. DSM 27419]
MSRDTMDSKDDVEQVNIAQVNELDGRNQDGDAVREIAVPDNKWLRRYRSVTFQMVILGLLSFSGPSMSDASATQYALSAVFAAIGIVGGCIVGALGFPLSGAGFYVLSKYRVQWFVIFAKALYGITAAFLYVAESSAMISYPEANRRGLYLSIWVMFRNLGSVISGAISLGLNIATAGAGAVSTSTYLVFVGLECIGVPAALLLTRSKKVIRSDGYGVPLLPRKSWRREFVLLWEHHKMRRPCFGYILDQKRWGPRTKAKMAYVVYMGASLYMGQIYIYWVLGQFASDVNSNARVGGVYRSWETVGQAISYGMDSHVKNEYIPIAVLLALTVVVAPGLWLVVQEIPEKSKDVVVADEHGMVVEAVGDKVTQAKPWGHRGEDVD